MQERVAAEQERLVLYADWLMTIKMVCGDWLLGIFLLS